MKPLPRKQTSTQLEWIQAINEIESIVSRDDLGNLIDRTVYAIEQFTRGKRVAFGWSGGKDSLVLEKVMELAGIPDCVLVITNLEYPAFSQWVIEHMPQKLEIINTGQDLSWLSKNQQMLFPRDGATAAKWFHVVQHEGQARYFKKHHLDYLALGRRRADGNYTGGKGEIHYMDTRGIIRYSPIAYWKHEDVLALIHYEKIILPPNYSWSQGFRVGTGPWAARQWTGSIENGWKEIWEIDESIVHMAAERIQSAKDFLQKRVDPDTKLIPEGVPWK